MRFVCLPLIGAVLIEVEPHHDSRGLFARTVCAEEFAAHGIPTEYPQCSTSFNRYRGTIRGLHFQRPPHEEAKIIRCTSGAIFDVIVDLRGDSDSYGRWYGVELSQDNRHSIYVPPGFAHGFQTLTDAAEIYYMIGAAYVPAAASGVRWDDPAIGIRWPLPVSMISDRDASLPYLQS